MTQSGPNFSENTDLSEILFIARKRAEKESPGRTAYISLWRNPRSIHEAFDLANRIIHIDEPVTVEGSGPHYDSRGRAGNLAR